METVTAVYENGVFRPLRPVDLPDQTRVEFEPRVRPADTTGTPSVPEGLAQVYEVLSRRYHSGHHDTAQRHNEHQP